MSGSTIHTIGHSTRSLQEFVALLQANAIDCLVDVRAFPGSRRHPQFNKESLQASLPAAGIAYVHERALGGRRKASEASANSPNTLWRNESFRRYSDYALGQEFQNALQRLEQRAHERSCALMCSEAVWWRCHRRIITDWLLARDWEVRHILGENKVENATMTPGAQVTDDGAVIYGDGAPAVQGSLF